MFIQSNNTGARKYSSTTATDLNLKPLPFYVLTFPFVGMRVIADIFYLAHTDKHKITFWFAGVLKRVAIRFTPANREDIHGVHVCYDLWNRLFHSCRPKNTN